MVKRTSRSGSMWFNATHHASCASCTFTSLSSTTITLARDIRPWPHRPFITLYACPGYCLSMLTNTRLWKIPAAGMCRSTILHEIVEDPGGGHVQVDDLGDRELQERQEDPLRGVPQPGVLHRRRAPDRVRAHRLRPQGDGGDVHLGVMVGERVEAGVIPE